MTSQREAFEQLKGTSAYIKLQLVIQDNAPQLKKFESVMLLKTQLNLYGKPHKQTKPKLLHSQNYGLSNYKKLLIGQVEKQNEA